MDEESKEFLEEFNLNKKINKKSTYYQQLKDIEEEIMLKFEMLDNFKKYLLKYKQILTNHILEIKTSNELKAFEEGIKYGIMSVKLKQKNE